MRQRRSETRKQLLDRLSQSCYRCGMQIADQAKLAYHEDTCTGAQAISA